MRPRTLRRRGVFYRRKRSHWRRNVALVLGVALAGFVVVDMMTGAPVPAPAEDAVTQIATPATPARTTPAELGSTTLASAASAPVSTPPPGRTSVVAGPPPGRKVHAETHGSRRAFTGAGARWGVFTVRNVKVTERAPVPRTFLPMVMRATARPESCKTCVDQVPF